MSNRLSRKHRREAPVMRGVCRKVAFRNYRTASGTAHRLADDDGRVYRCPHCGWYHVTGDADAGGFDRRQGSFAEPPKVTAAAAARKMAAASQRDR